MNFQSVSFDRCECAFPCSVVLVHMPSAPCHVREPSTRGCAFVCYTVLYTVVQYLYFKPRMCRNKCKSSGDIAGATVLLEVLYYKI